MSLAPPKIADIPIALPPMRSSRRSLVVLWISCFFTALGLMVMLPFFPLYLRQLGETDPARIKTWSGVIVGAAPFMAALLGGIWGSIGDQVGRRAMVLRAMVGITLFVGLMSLATSPWHLLVLRICQGCVAGFVAPAMTLASLIAPSEWQGRISSRMQMAVLLGSVAGPLLGAPLAAEVGFRALALGAALLSLASAGLVYRFVPEPARSSEETSAPLPSTRTLGSILRNAVRDVVRVLVDPRVRGLFVALLLVRLSNAAQNPTLVLYVEKMIGSGESAARVASWVFAANPIAVLIFLPVWGRIADQRPPKDVLSICMIGGAVFTLLQGAAASLIPFALFRFLSGAFLAGVFPASFAMVTAASQRERRGGALGTAFSALTMGLALGPFVAAVVDPWFGYRALVIGCGILLASASIGVVSSRVYSTREPR